MRALVQAKATYRELELKRTLNGRAMDHVSTLQNAYNRSHPKRGVAGTSLTNNWWRPPAAFMTITDTSTPSNQRDELRSNLLGYCKRDTEAMVELYRKFT